MFKKIMYCFAVAALVTACSEDFDDWASPQSNEPEEPQAFEYAATVDVAAEDIDIATAGDVIPLFTYSADMPEGYEFDSLAIDVIDEETNTKYALPSTIEDTQVSVNKEDLTSIVESIYGKRPVPRELKCITTLYLYTSAAHTSVVRSTDEMTIKVTPEAPVIESAYYYVGGANGWSDTDQTYLLTNGGDDPYDNPVFKVTVPAVGGDHWFKIAPASAYTRDEGFWGGDMVGVAVNGTSDMEGKLVVGKNDEVAQSWKIDEGANPGLFYTIEVNMLDQTYKITTLNFGAWFYEIGNESGWSTSHALYGPDSDGKYQGYYYLNGEFKFKPHESDWEGDYEFDGEGRIVDNGVDNCPDPGAGFYQIDVDLAAGTYALTKVESITVVGAFNGWEPADAATHMTYNVDGGYWEATLNLTDNGFKFAMNDGWDISWGGADGDPAAYDNLSQNNGKDLDLPDGAGTYNIKLYLAYEGGNKVVLTKQ